MVNLKDNSYRMKTKTGEYLTFKLDMTAMLRLENIVGSSVEATRIFLAVSYTHLTLPTKRIV